MEQPQQQQLSQEQIAALQEKIKNMSPEELKEFQKKQCIFCQIIEGKVNARKIYDDDKCIAILDINPASPGHMLLMPKEHYTIMPQLPEDELTHIFMVTKSLSNVVLRGLDARGTNIIVANGPAAGQKAQHFMIHIIPRKEKDGIQFNLPQRKIPEKDIKVLREKLSDKMIEMLGEKKEVKEEIETKKEEKAVIKKEKPIKTKPIKKEPVKKKSLKKKSKQKMSETQRVSEHAQKSKKISDKSKKEKTDLDDIANILGVK